MKTIKQIIKGIIIPFKKGNMPEHFGITEKLIVYLYFPIILIMWWGYYMWKEDTNEFYN